jgi:hypothetical protein
VAGIGVAFAGIALIGLSLGQGSPLFAFTPCVAADLERIGVPIDKLAPAI